MVLFRILFKNSTILKQSTAQSSHLPSNKLQQIPVGTFLVLQSFATPANNHIQLSFKDIQFKGLSSNWFAYTAGNEVIEPNGEIRTRDLELTKRLPSNVPTVSQMLANQLDKNVVKVPAAWSSFGSQNGFLKLVFNTDTVIKRAPVNDSSVLNPSAIQQIPAGTELVLLTNPPNANNVIELPVTSSHVKFTLKDIEFKGFSWDWYAFIGHVGVQLLG